MPIDYERLGREVERQRRQAELRRQSVEHFIGTVAFGLAVFGIAVGVITLRWWAGLLAFLTPVLPFRIPGLQRVFEACFAGITSYATWVLIDRTWPRAPLIAQILISVAAGVIGLLVHEGLAAAIGRRNAAWHGEQPPASEVEPLSQQEGDEK